MTNSRRSRNRFSAFCIESDPETKWLGGSEYLTAKEWTEDHLQPKALYESNSKLKELDPLASLTIIEGVEPLEHRPQNITDPFWRVITAILEGQRESELIDIKIYSDPEPDFEPRMEQPTVKKWNKGD